jgi:hypothetical protein
MASSSSWKLCSTISWTVPSGISGVQWSIIFSSISSNSTASVPGYTISSISNWRSSSDIETYGWDQSETHSDKKLSLWIHCQDRSSWRGAITHLLASTTTVSIGANILLKSGTRGKFVPTCHNCGKIGHIRPNCYLLKSHRPWIK